MIQLNSICKSFEGRTVLEDINFSFENGKTNFDYRAEWLWKDGTDEMYCRAAYSGVRGDSV